MEQNTAPNNNTQFPYPDFSGQGQGNPQSQPAPQGQPQVQQQSSVQNQPQDQSTDESKKIGELRKSLEQLKATQEASSQPKKEKQDDQGTQAQQKVSSQQSPTPVHPATNTQEENQDSYQQQPKPLPGMDKKVPQEETATVSTKVVPPTGDGFDPLPPDLPKFKESLEQIMPEPSKPKQKEGKKGEKETAEVTQSQQTQQPIQKASLRPDGIQAQPNIQDQHQHSPQGKDNLKITQESLKSGGELTMQKLFSEAINRNASDLHLSVGYPPILRIDGELVNLDEKLLGPEDVERLIFSVLSDERKELLEVNREIDFAYTYEGVMNARFRVNAYYTMKNLSAAFRLIPSRVKTIEELKLPQIYNQFAKLRQGLILVTGPTGHGKSTTIASILEAINRTRFCHIITIEDPIEYVFEGKKALIDQREMNDDTHSWNIALRSALRQDPDVILVGEMRDFETIAAAITLAETGHLVFATLHTNSASQTLDRIIDVFPENQQQQVRTQVAHTLEAVIAQRLIPLDKGGRRAVSEIMLNNSAVSNLIREGKMYQVDNVIRTSADVGMKYLERSLVDLVREGVISVQKAQEYAVHPEEVLRLLKA